jgi:hypothetical protein
VESWQPFRRLKDKIRNNSGEKACPYDCPQVNLVGVARMRSLGKLVVCAAARHGKFFPLSVELLQSVLK